MKYQFLRLKCRRVVVLLILVAGSCCGAAETRGETFGIVGESGSGKSVTNLAILGLLNRKTARITGEVLFKGRDLLTASNDELRRVRGKEIAMIFQDPFACLHPMYRIGDQIAEAIPRSKIAAQLVSLDLSLGTLGDAGARALAAGKFPKLERIDVTRCYLSADGVAALSQIAKHVEAGDQRDDGGDPQDRYIAAFE